MKMLAVFSGFFFPPDFKSQYELVSDQTSWDECDDFLIPVDSKLTPMVNLSFFSPTAFGSLHLAFNLKRGSKVPSDFVKSLLNSPKAGRFQRLHFYNAERGAKSRKELFLNLRDAIDANTSSITARPWCENLLPYIERPTKSADIVHSNSEMIFVIDRFPKGSSHYLCLPRKRIDTWWYLTPEDIPLLLRMQSEAEKFAQMIDSASDFKFGFHVIPSMKQLHLHVVNKDFNGPQLTAFQWNAFNTDFLISVPQVIAELESKGKIEMSERRWKDYWALLSGPLHCSICGRGFRKLDALKRHYLHEYKINRENSC